MIEINQYGSFFTYCVRYIFAAVKNKGLMINWLVIGSVILMVIAGKCVKELIDVRVMNKMDSAERAELLARRHFYDNHA